ncbi:MAG: hypothetical protein ACK5X3_11745, partial [Pseudomonadota bacterium]
MPTPRARDVGLFRRVLGGLSCRDYEGAAEAVPEAFRLTKSSVPRCFVRASAKALPTHHEQRHDDQDRWCSCSNGRVTVLSPTRISMTNRFNGQTDTFSALFRAVKGGRELVLVNEARSGDRYSLVR